MNINFIDGEAVIDPYSLDDYSPNGPHLSKSGYKKFSEYLVKYLKQIK